MNVEENKKGYKMIKFKGSYKNYYDFINHQIIIDTTYFRIRKNFLNLGLWIVKDSQGKHTLNIFKIRVQF